MIRGDASNCAGDNDADWETHCLCRSRFSFSWERKSFLYKIHSRETIGKREKIAGE
jgi:hypothetical protein